MDMTISPPPARPAVRRRLARRLLWLTCGVVLLVQVLFLLPAVVRARGDWLRERIAYGQLAALTFDDQAPTAAHGDLLLLAGVEGVRLVQPGNAPIVLGTVEPAPSRVTDPGRESRMAALGATLAELLDGRDRILLIESRGPVRPGTTVTVAVRSAALTRYLRSFTRDAALLGLLLAALTGLSLHFALRHMLVRPIQQLTDSIAAFRADPERTPPSETGNLAPQADEVALAAHELAEMQRELREALWRRARLAALGTSAAKVSHDLRSMLAPALLSAERLQNNTDPGVRRIGDIVVRGVERATELVRSGLEYAREGPITLTRTRFGLRDAVAETTEQVHVIMPALGVDNRIEPTLEVEADHELLERVMTNLLRNAGEAGARTVTIEATGSANQVGILVSDDGPGLPAPVQAALFKPFVTGGRRGSSGLGLAIARDLMRAHRGDIDLIDTGPQGTRFRLTLPASLSLKPNVSPAGSASPLQEKLPRP